MDVLLVRHQVVLEYALTGLLTLAGAVEELAGKVLRVVREGAVLAAVAILSQEKLAQIFTDWPCVATARDHSFLSLSEKLVSDFGLLLVLAALVCACEGTLLVFDWQFEGGRLTGLALEHLV